MKVEPSMKLILHHKHGKIKFSLPTGWNEVTYRQYLLYLEHKDDHLKVFSIFTGIDKEIWEEPHSPTLFDSMNEQLNFLSTEPICKRPDAIHRNGETYMIPTTLIRLVFDKYQDLVTLYRINSKDELTIMQAVPQMVGIFACLDYDTQEELQEIADDILEMRADHVYTLATFFFRKLQESKHGRSRTQTVLRTTLHILKLALICFPVSLVFLWSFIRSPKEILPSVSSLISYLWRRYIFGDKLIAECGNAKRFT